MEVVRFRNRSLEECSRSESAAMRRWWSIVGRRYVAGISELFGADSVQDLYALRRLDFHPLRGDRAGQHALRLTGQIRLIVMVHDDERTLTVEEVVDYHG